MMDGLTVVFGAIAAIGGAGGIVSLVLVTANRKKITAEARLIGVNADDVLSGRALEMYDRAMREATGAKTEVSSCREEVRALRTHVDILERHIGRLEDQMIDAGLQPNQPTPAPFHWPPYVMGGTAP